MIFIYFLLSIICSSIIEMVNNLSKLRAKMLEQWLIDNFDYEKGPVKLGSAILETSSVDGLTLRGKKPSYLPSSVFVRALFDQIMKCHHEKNNQEVKPYGMAELKEGIEKTDLLRPGIRRMILQYMQEANDDLEKTRKSMETWFDNAMERLGGTFKKQSQIRLFIIGLILSIVLNVDTVVLVKYFYQNPKMASQIADAAQKTANDAITYEKYAGLSNKINKDTSSIDTTTVNYKKILVEYYT